MLKFNTKNICTRGLNDNAIIRKYHANVKHIVDKINVGKLPGTEMMGWQDLIRNYETSELLNMRKKAEQWINSKIKYVIVIGIGGSYVGVRAALDMCLTPFNQTGPEIIWVHNMASTYLCSLIEKIKNEKFAIIVISKSGTTLEPALAFRLLRKTLEKQMGVMASRKNIVAITDYEKGTLHDLAKKNHYVMFGIRNDIGGRFSTLTPVGMFVMMVKGIDSLMILKGAKQALNDTSHSDLATNSAFLYACYRHYLHTVKQIDIENFIVYDPSLTFVCEMWRQLFGESEGKQHKGLYPTTSLFTTDLHSMGQYLQEGTRNFFETTLIVKEPKLDATISVKDDEDSLRYLHNRSIDFINKKAFEGTIAAHTKLGKVDNFIIEISKADAYHFGYLFAWFAMTVTMSGYLLKINPFNQPGVDAYKKNMFKLLGKKI